MHVVLNQATVDVRFCVAGNIRCVAGNIRGWYHTQQQLHSFNP
jgi:hypothetical protein